MAIQSITRFVTDTTCIYQLNISAAISVDFPGNICPSLSICRFCGSDASSIPRTALFAGLYKHGTCSGPPMQSRHRHPVRLQDANGVHGPRRRVDDIVHVYRSIQCVGKRNAKYFQRRNLCNAARRRRRMMTSLPVVPKNYLNHLTSSY